MSIHSGFTPPRDDGVTRAACKPVAPSQSDHHLQHIQIFTCHLPANQQRQSSEGMEPVQTSNSVEIIFPVHIYLTAALGGRPKVKAVT